MFRITTDSQHIHTDASMDEGDVLALAEKQASGIRVAGRVLVDVKSGTEVCACGLKPDGKGWTVLIYYVQDAETDG